MIQVTKELKWFLAGFIEGEGSLCISIKAHPTARFGYLIDPEFFLYQHKSAKELLEMAQVVFKTGRIYPKQGNEDVLVYSITSQRTIIERVIPYFEKYIQPFGSKQKWNNFKLFREITYSLERGEHRTREGALKIVDLAYQTNHAGKQRKRLKEEVIQRILRDQTPKSEEN